jgi:hypothetical protein
MKLTTLAILLIVYGLGLYIWNKKTSRRLNVKASRRVIQFHYVLTFFVVVSLVLNWVDSLSFSGQWTTRVIIIGFLLSGFFIYPLSAWSEKFKIERLYFRLFSYMPTIFGFALLIPFVGALAFGTVVGQLLNPLKKIYFDNDTLRVQSSYIGPMWPPGIFVYQKKGLLEKQLVHSPISDIFFDSVTVSERDGRTLIIFLDKKSGRQDTLKLEVE